MTETTITLTVSIPDDSDLTWGQLREAFAYLTPTADNLRVAVGLSGAIDRDTAWGHFRAESDTVLSPHAVDNLYA